MEHLAEREAAFTHKALLSIAITHALGEVPLEKLEQAIMQTQVEGHLVQGHKVLDGTHWTTQDAIALEKELLSFAEVGKNKVAAITSQQDVENKLKNTILRVDQKEAIGALSTSQDKVVLVQGYAGTGKTTMLVGFQSIINNHGYELCGLAPSHTAVEELSSRGIKAQTLQSFLVEAQKIENAQVDYSKKIYVLDEASMVSSRDMADLLKFINSKNTRLIAVGDKDQLASPEAGKPFILMQQVGIKTVGLTVIQRQDPNRVELREAVKHTIDKDFDKAFAALDRQSEKPRIIEIRVQEERLQAMVDDYLSRSPDKRANILLITPLNADRVLVNELVRDGLKAEGEINKTGEVFSMLVPRHMTQVEMKHVANYHVGDVVRFNRTMYSLGVEKNSYLVVDEVDTNKGFLTLRSEDKILFWQPNNSNGIKRGAVEVYSKEKRELCVGDKIIWTRSDKTQGLINGAKAKVEDVSADNIFVRSEDGNIKQLNVRNYSDLHWDHAYTVTTYAAQGKTKTEVIDHEDSRLKHLTNQRNFYVVITRAEQQTTIYTDDKKELLKKIQRNTGEKLSALEVTGKLIKKQRRSKDYKKEQQDKEHKKSDFSFGDRNNHSSKNNRSNKKTDRDIIFTDYQKQNIALAQKLWNESIPIEGTIAERYLRESCDITKPLPDDLRFHPNMYLRQDSSYPALLAASRDKDGQVQAVQVTYFNVKTLEKHEKSEKNDRVKRTEEIQKQVFGVINGSAVTLQKGDSLQKRNSVVICESLETGLSLKEIEEKKTIKMALSLTNFKNIPLDHKVKDVVLCFDGRNNYSQKVLEQNVSESLIRDGKNVFWIKPNASLKDYNDILKEQGKDALKKMVANPVDFKSTMFDRGKYEKYEKHEIKKGQEFGNKHQKAFDARKTQEFNKTDNLRTSITEQSHIHKPPPAPDISKQIIKNIEREL